LRARGEVIGRIGEVGFEVDGFVEGVAFWVVLIGATTLLLALARLWEPVLLRWFNWLRVKACMDLA
jgi:hypothetical protein